VDRSVGSTSSNFKHISPHSRQHDLAFQEQCGDVWSVESALFVPFSSFSGCLTEPLQGCSVYMRARECQAARQPLDCSAWLGSDGHGGPTAHCHLDRMYRRQSKDYWARLQARL
jgi:hypothetical protein